MVLNLFIVSLIGFLFIYICPVTAASGFLLLGRWVLVQTCAQFAGGCVSSCLLCYGKFEGFEPG